MPAAIFASDRFLVAAMPGKSLLPLLSEPEKTHHEQVFATINGKGDTAFEMRSIIGPDHIYIFNKWADGKAQFYGGKYSGGLALKGFEAAAKENAQARERLDFFYSRAKEELYDLQHDPDALANLAGDEGAASSLRSMRQSMLQTLTATGDPFLDDYRTLLGQAGYLGDPSRPVLSMDFEAVLPGDPADHLLQHEKLSLAPDAGVGTSTGLRAEYTGSDRGSERIVTHVFLPEPGLEFSLNYDVRFDQDFQFVRGGKLLGLGPEEHIAGGRPIVPSGWSARVTFKEGGAARLYTYHQDMQGQYGDRGVIHKPFNFERERYYSVSLHVRVNDPPEAANGFSRLYVDGDLIENHEALRLRGTGGQPSLINKFMFSSFHGGHMPEWAPRDEAGNYKTVFATFDNIAVYDGERVRPAVGK